MKNKSADIDSFPAKVLKSVGDIVAPVLADIVNSSLVRGVFPDSEKIARVVPIFKDVTTGQYQFSLYSPRYLRKLLIGDYLII